MHTEIVPILRALRRAKTARRCAQGFTRTPLERAHHVARARMWLAFAHGLNQMSAHADQPHGDH